MAKSLKLTNDDKAAHRLAEAIRLGHVVHFSGAGGRGTVGPYHRAVGGPGFAAFFDGATWERYGTRPGRHEGAVLDVAYTVVYGIGVANTIDALKAALRAAGGSYKNLSTPITAPPGRRAPARKRPSATLADLDALVLAAEAAGIERTPIGYVANIRGRLSRDERSRFWRAPGAGSWDLRGAPLTQGEIVAAVHALRFALDRQAGGRRTSGRSGRRATGRRSTGRRGGGIIDAAGPISPRDYPGLFQDTNRDGIPDVDDPNPTGPPGKVSVEETRLSDELAAVIDQRARWQAALPRFKAALAQIARAQGTSQAKVLARVKTPYSVVNKLLHKRLKTLTDTTGGMLIVQTAAEVRRLDAAIGAGALGPVLERVDYYKAPNAGYRAIHYIVDFPGIGPSEVQIKTVRLKVVQSATHTAYKQGRLSVEGSEQLYSLAAAADEGDPDAVARFGALTQAQMVTIARGEGLRGAGMLAMGGRTTWGRAAAWHAARGRDRYGRVSIRQDDDLDKLFGEAW